MYGENMEKMNSEKEIRDLLSEGETLTLECKSALGGVPKSMWDTYSAFANTYGGTILLGVEEKRGALVVSGVDEPSSVVKDIWNTVNSDKVSSNVLFNESVYVVSLDGKDIVVVEVPRAERYDRPVFLNKNLYHSTFRRNGEGDYHCSREQIVSMLRDQSDLGVDSKVIEGMDVAELNQESIRGYRNLFKLSKPDHVWNKLENVFFLMKIGAASKGADGCIHPTAAGLLFFGDFMSIMNEFPNFFLDYREYLVDGERWSDRVCSADATWSGNVFDFYFRVINRMLADVKVPFQLKDGLTRVDDTPVHKALREALTNALVHADYGGRCGVVINKSFRHVRIQNPGVFRLSIEDAICGGVSDARNPRVFNMFNLIDVGERSGSGLCDLYDIWKTNGFPRPILTESFDPDRTSLTLDFSSSHDGYEMDVEGDVPMVCESPVSYAAVSRRRVVADEKLVLDDSVRLSKSARLILDVLRKEPSSSAKSVAELLGLSARGVEKNIKKMKELGLVSRIGPDKGGRWQVNV